MAVEVAPRIVDRELIEGLAELRGDLKRIEDGQKNLQKQVDDVRRQVDDTRKELKDFMLWGFGVTFAGMFVLERLCHLGPTACTGSGSDESSGSGGARSMGGGGIERVRAGPQRC